MQRRHFLMTTALLLVRHVQRAHGAPTARGIDDLLEATRKRHDLPAMAGAVVFNDEIVSGASGVRKFGDATPVTASDQFHLGSCTKSMTGTLAGLLVEEGKLKWESTLAELLPDVAGSMRPEFRTITLEQLLAHRGGFGPRNSPQGVSLKSLLDDGKLGTTPREQRRKFIELILQDPPDFPPGKQFAYSNVGFIAAGVFMETVTDLSWEELIRKRLFEPLEMTTAGFGAMGTAGKVDQPWQHRMRDGVRTPVEPGPLADNPPVVGPAGRVHCSPGDWGKYAREHLRGARGKSKLARAETFERLHTPGFGGNYSAGWFVTGKTASGATLSHNGSNNSNFAIVSVNTHDNWAVAVLTNQAGEAAVQACSELTSPLIGRVKFG